MWGNPDPCPHSSRRHEGYLMGPEGGGDIWRRRGRKLLRKNYFTCRRYQNINVCESSDQVTDKYTEIQICKCLPARSSWRCLHKQWKRNVGLSSFFTLLSINSHTTKSSHLWCTIQWFLVYSELYNHHHNQRQDSSPLQKKACTH